MRCFFDHTGHCQGAVGSAEGTDTSVAKHCQKVAHDKGYCEFHRAHEIARAHWDGRINLVRFRHTPKRVERKVAA